MRRVTERSTRVSEQKSKHSDARKRRILTISHRNFGVSRKHSSNSIKGFIFCTIRYRAIFQAQYRPTNRSLEILFLPLFPIKRHDHLGKTTININRSRSLWTTHSPPSLFCQTDTTALKLFSSRGRRFRTVSTTTT